MYFIPRYAAIGGNVDIPLGVFRVYGGISGDLNIRTREAQLTANGHVCIQGIKSGACLGGSAVLSSRRHPLLSRSPIRPSSQRRGPPPRHREGQEVWTGRSVALERVQTEPLLGVCDRPLPGRRECQRRPDVAGSPAARRSRASRSPGSRRCAEGPCWQDRAGSASCSTATTGHSSGPFAGVRSDQYTTAWFGLDHGRPGTYTITPLPGSVPFGTLREPQPRLRRELHRTRDRQGRPARTALRRPPPWRRAAGRVL